MNIKDYLSYEPETGLFYWIKPRKGIRKNKIAGRRDFNGYITICFDSKHYLAHRLAWWFTHGIWPTNQIDHENSLRSDNRLENLRPATISQNAGNQRPQIGRSSKFKGVSWHKKDKRWRCTFRNKHIGHFLTEQLAAEAYNEEATKFYGEFAKLNSFD